MTKDFGEIPLPPPRHAKSFRTVARWCLFGISFLVPWFFLPATNDPVGITKFVGIGFLVLVAFICFLGAILEERKIVYPRSWLGLCLLTFLVLQAVSAWFSIAPVASFFGNLSAPDSLISYVLYILVFYLFFFFYRREDIPMVGGSIGSGLLVATLISLWQFFHGSSLNPFGGTLAWGIMMLFVFAVLGPIRPSELSQRVKIFFFGVVGITLLVLILVNYQSLWLLLAVFVMLVAALRFEPREHFQYAFAIIAIALFFALVSYRLPIFSGVAQDIQPSISTSVTVAQNALHGKGILIGTGPATFNLDYAAYRPTASNNASYWATLFSSGHDFTVTLLATSGLLGFLLFVFIVLQAIQHFLHIQALDTDLAMMVSAIAFLCVALFLYPGFFVELILLFALLGLLHGATSRRVASFEAVTPWKGFAISIVIMATAATVLAGAFVGGEKYMAAVFSGQSSALAGTGDLSGAFAKINSAIGLDQSDRYYRSATDIFLAEARALSSANSDVASVELPAVISNALKSAQAAVSLNSKDPANWGQMGAVYEAIMPAVGGADASAAAAYQRAADLDPANPDWPVSIARVYMESVSLLPVNATTDAARVSGLATAEQYLNKAISLKNDYAKPRVLLVQLYLQRGNLSQAIEKVQDLKRQNPLDLGVSFELAYLYYQNNQIDQAQQEFQVATILNPTYANARYFLGLIYDQKGMTAQALDQFQKIQALSPGNAQVAAIIANIQAGRSALANNISAPALSGQDTASPVIAPDAHAKTQKVSK